MENTTFQHFNLQRDSSYKGSTLVTQKTKAVFFVLIPHNLYLYTECVPLDKSGKRDLPRVTVLFKDAAGTLKHNIMGFQEEN